MSRVWGPRALSQLSVRLLVLAQVVISQVHEIKPWIGPYAVSMEPAWDSLSLPLSLLLPCPLSLSLSLKNKEINLKTKGKPCLESNQNDWNLTQACLTSNPVTSLRTDICIIQEPAAWGDMLIPQGARERFRLTGMQCSKCSAS